MTRAEEDRTAQTQSLYDKKVAQAQRLHEAVRQLRGRLLNSMSVIDVSIARLLATYFCQHEQRRDLAFSDVFVRLNSKTTLLEKVVKKSLPSEFIRENWPNVFSDLKELRDFRNTLAHATIDVSDEALAKGPDVEVGFVHFKNGERHVDRITPQIANDYEVKANMVHTCLIELGRVMGVTLPT
jgi:hypothetical protein